MRQARFLRMSGRLLAGLILAGGLATAGPGCCQPYYCYYGTPACPPAPLPSAVQAGPVCDVPTQAVEGGTKVAGGSARSTTVTGGQTTSDRVVVSQPRSSSSRFPWRRSDQDGSYATTTIKGTVDDSSVNR